MKTIISEESLCDWPSNVRSPRTTRIQQSSFLTALLPDSERAKQRWCSRALAFGIYRYHFSWKRWELFLRGGSFSNQSSLKCQFSSCYTRSVPVHACIRVSTFWHILLARYLIICPFNFIASIAALTNLQVQIIGVLQCHKYICDHWAFSSRFPAWPVEHVWLRCNNAVIAWLGGRYDQTRNDDATYKGSVIRILNWMGTILRCLVKVLIFYSLWPVVKHALWMRARKRKRPYHVACTVQLPRNACCWYNSARLALQVYRPWSLYTH
jgi:hypothetical protein